MSERQEAEPQSSAADAGVTRFSPVVRAPHTAPSRGDERAVPRIAWLVLILVLALAALEFPVRIGPARSTLDQLSRWPDRAAQMREVAGGTLYDGLVAADRQLPRDAKVMLVTTGQDVRHAEYIAFHRALYLLAPRPVWWVVPVERDGTWELRWWTPSPLDPPALQRQWRSFGATHLLVLGAEPSFMPGYEPAILPGGARLYSLAPAVEPGLPRGESPSVREIDCLWPLRLAAACVLILLAGHLIVDLILGKSRRLPRVERLALSWLLGAGAVSLAMYWLGVLGLTLAYQIGSLSLLIVLGTLLHSSTRISMSRLQRRVFDPRSIIHIPGSRAGASRMNILTGTVLMALIVAEIVYTALTAVGQPLRIWDSWVSWGMHARLIYLHDGLDPLAYADPSRTVTLQSYPLLVPSVEAWTYGWLGAPDDRFAGVQAVLFLAALLGLVYTALRPHVSRTFALLVVLVLVSISFIGGLAGIVFADIPLAAYVVAAGLYLRRWLAGGSIREAGAGSAVGRPAAMDQVRRLAASRRPARKLPRLCRVWIVRATAGVDGLPNDGFRRGGAGRSVAHTSRGAACARGDFSALYPGDLRRTRRQATADHRARRGTCRQPGVAWPLVAAAGGAAGPGPGAAPSPALFSWNDGFLSGRHRPDLCLFGLRAAGGACHSLGRPADGACRSIGRTLARRMRRAGARAPGDRMSRAGCPCEKRSGGKDVSEITKASEATQGDVAWQVRPYRAGDEQGIVRLFVATFGKPLTEARYRWKVLQSPWSIDAPTVWLAEAGERIVGHYAGTPMRFRLRGETRHIVHACDAMTDAEFRRQGILSVVGTAAHASWAAADVPLVTGLHFGGWGSRRHYLGWREQYQAAWVWRLLRPERMLRRRLRPPMLAAAAGAVVAGLAPTWNLGWDLLLRAAADDVQVEPVERPGPEFDTLWSTLEPMYEALVVRDRAWVAYRYHDAPEFGYRLLLARRGGQPAGYLVYRLTSIDGRTTGWIPDLFTAPDDAAARAALLRGALLVLSAAGADHVRALVPMHTSSFTAFRRAGFLLGRGTFDFSIVPLVADLPFDVLRDPRRWFAMGGDFDVI